MAKPPVKPTSKPAVKPVSKPKPRPFNDPDGERIPSKKEADAMMNAPKYAKGGKIDGVAKRGRTSAKMVKMACGGKAKKG